MAVVPILATKKPRRIGWVDLARPCFFQIIHAFEDAPSCRRSGLATHGPEVVILQKKIMQYASKQAWFASWHSCAYPRTCETDFAANLPKRWRRRFLSQLPLWWDKSLLLGRERRHQGKLPGHTPSPYPSPDCPRLSWNCTWRETRCYHRCHPFYYYYYYQQLFCWWRRLHTLLYSTAAMFCYPCNKWYSMFIYETWGGEKKEGKNTSDKFFFRKTTRVRSSAPLSYSIK